MARFFALSRDVPITTSLSSILPSLSPALKGPGPKWGPRRTGFGGTHPTTSLSARTSSRLLLEVDVGERLPVGASQTIKQASVDGPGRREPALRNHLRARFLQGARLQKDQQENHGFPSFPKGDRRKNDRSKYKRDRQPQSTQSWTARLLQPASNLPALVRAATRDASSQLRRDGGASITSMPGQYGLTKRA
jgi:hypothetical protein